MTKKYGGVIHDWYKIEVPEYAGEYGGNLGFMVAGRLDEDPTGRGFAGYPLRTSLVVKWDCAECSDELMIETLNTQYHLGRQRFES